MTSPDAEAAARALDLSPLVVPGRFNGPTGSGNGGWCAGALAARLQPGGGAVAVRLSAPPPLEQPMRLDAAGARGDSGADGPQLLALASDGSPVLSAASAADVGDPVPVVDGPAAARAAERFAGRSEHPFPTCFTCGTERSDGLGLTPGPLDGLLDGRRDGRPGDTACCWTPAEPVDEALVWAALDCPGAWTVDMATRPMVLGSITAQLRRLPEQGEPCVVVGRDLGTRGRKTTVATALWSGDELLAQAGALWIAVRPGTFGVAAGSAEP